MAGEVTWRVPSLSLADEAIELFTDRARRPGPDFTVTDDNAAAVTEICRRLDGMPLAIELAAARVRALSLTEILDSLHDRFRLLTGGARTAVRRQQTLRASVDWSHALLTEPERVLFRRLAVFMGGFDLDAAQGGRRRRRGGALPGARPAHPAGRQVAGGGRKRRRPNAIPAAGDGAPVRAGEARRVRRGRRRARPSPRPLHRDGRPARRAGQPPAIERRIEQAETEIDNLRAAFAWSRENSDIERALGLASSLQPLWLARGRIREGRTGSTRSCRRENRRRRCGAGGAARALADKAYLDNMRATESMARAHGAVAIARELDDRTAGPHPDCLRSRRGLGRRPRPGRTCRRQPS